VAADAASGQKPASRLLSKPVTRGSPSGVVIKSLAEIKREKLERMQQQPTAAVEARPKSSEPPAKQNQRDSKIKLIAARGTADYHVLGGFVSHV